MTSQQLLECGLRKTVQWAGTPSPSDASGCQEPTSQPKNSPYHYYTPPGPWAFQGLLLHVDLVWDRECISGRIFLA